MKMYLKTLNYKITCMYKDVKIFMSNPKTIVTGIWFDFLSQYFVSKHSNLDKLLLKRTNGGSYSTYYQISTTMGIKMLETLFDTYSKALNSFSYKEAEKEYDLLKKAKSKFSNIPEAYGVKIIKFEGDYRVAILMQHLGNRTLRSEYFDGRIKRKEKNEVEKDIEKQLEKAGIFHSDLHNGNIMRYKNEWWVIDFTPSYVSIV